MDRIDRLLERLIDTQACATHYDEVRNPPAAYVAETRRDALRRLIADEWRAKDAALEAAQPTMFGMLCERWGHPDNWPEDRQGAVVYQGILAALSRDKGES